MAIWREDVRSALQNLGGQGTLEEIYDAIRQLRPNSRPPTWHAIVRRELEYNSSDSESFKKRFDLFYSVNGLGAGVWGLRALEPKTPNASDLGDANPERVKTTIYRILRDTKLARQLKKLHNDRCQICGDAIQLPGGRTYSEAHHIRPLGKPHNGPDLADNIVVVCPNHHALLDFGALTVSPDTFKTVNGHEISQKYFDYHNNVIVPTAQNAQQDQISDAMQLLSTVVTSTSSTDAAV